jgi:hypothetical protein
MNLMAGIERERDREGGSITHRIPAQSDPNVWSGRASQEVSSSWFSVLHQCIRPLIGAVDCSGPTWISARGRSLYRTSLDRAIWVTSVRSRREDRSPSRRYLSQTSAGKGLSASLLRHRRLLISSVPWFVLMAVPSSRPDPRHATRAGAVKAGPPGPLAELGLDRAEHGAMIMQVWSNHRLSSSPRSLVPWRAPPRRCARACWRVRSPARCGAVASLRPRSTT